MLRSAATATRQTWGQGPVDEAPMPPAWPLFASQVRPRPGNVVQVMAAPGVGKTAFSLHWVLNAQARTLYIASDTNMASMTEQMAAYATEQTREDVTRRMRNGQLDRISSAIRQASPDLYIDPLDAPTLEQVEERILALTELWGETPDYVVLDTISDVQRDGDSYGAWRHLWLSLRTMSRYYQTTIMFLHHLKGGTVGSNGTSAPQMSDGKYGSHEFAEIVLGLHLNGQQLTASVLKNRDGRKGLTFPFQADFSRLSITELPGGSP